MRAGACGCETAVILPKGEQAQGPYWVSTTETTVPAPLLVYPFSLFTTRPSPSKLWRGKRVPVVMAWVAGRPPRAARRPPWAARPNRIAW
jgi:hypothetical protein